MELVFVNETGLWNLTDGNEAVAMAVISSIVARICGGGSGGMLEENDGVEGHFVENR